MGQTKPRPHWVSQLLTKPWEIEHRNLVYFDFVLRKLGPPTPSKRLFRESRGRDAFLERRLNFLVETPLSKARERLLAPGQVSIDDWETYRAVVLLNLLQPVRLFAKEQKTDAHLHAILSQPDPIINKLALVFAEEHQIVRLGSVDPRHQLFYPQAGIFPFITRDDGCITGWAIGRAVPITPEIAFAVVSKTALCDWLFETSFTSSHLQAFSLMGSLASRVVLPPAFREIAKADTDWLLKYRADLDDYARRFVSIRGRYCDAVRRHGAVLERATDGSDCYRVTNGVPIPPPDTFMPDG